MQIFKFNFSKFEFRISYHTIWNDTVMRLLPKHLGIEFKTREYIKTKSGIKPWYWYVKVNLIFISFTFLCDVHYKSIFKLKVIQEN